MEKKFTKAIKLLKSQKFNLAMGQMYMGNSPINVIIIQIQPLNLKNNNNTISINCTVDTKNNTITLSNSLHYNGEKIYNHNYSPQIQEINQLFQQYLNKRPEILTNCPDNMNKGYFYIVI